MLTRQQWLLVKLAEEASEVAKAALKAAQFGLGEINPATNVSNDERITAELIDLELIVRLLTRYTIMGKVNYELIEGVGGYRYSKLRHYYKYSQSIGLVDPLETI